VERNLYMIVVIDNGFLAGKFNYYLLVPNCLQQQRLMFVLGMFEKAAIGCSTPLSNGFPCMSAVRRAMDSSHFNSTKFSHAPRNIK
jgi:hypothetical protein